MFQSAEINAAACKIAREIANEGDAIVCGGLSPVPGYVTGKGEEAVRQEFRNQVDVFMEHEVDFVLAEVEFYCLVFGLATGCYDMLQIYC